MAFGAGVGLHPYRPRRDGRPSPARGRSSAQPHGRDGRLEPQRPDRLRAGPVRHPAVRRRMAEAAGGRRRGPGGIAADPVHVLPGLSGRVGARGHVLARPSRQHMARAAALAADGAGLRLDEVVDRPVDDRTARHRAAAVQRHGRRHRLALRLAADDGAAGLGLRGDERGQRRRRPAGAVLRADAGAVPRRLGRPVRGEERAGRVRGVGGGDRPGGRPARPAAPQAVVRPGCAGRAARAVVDLQDLARRHAGRGHGAGLRLGASAWRGGQGDRDLPRRHRGHGAGGGGRARPPPCRSPCSARTRR